jgi:hypothetical protein
MVIEKKGGSEEVTDPEATGMREKESKMRSGEAPSSWWI